MTSSIAEENCTEPASLGHMDAFLYTDIIRQQSYSLMPMDGFFTSNRTIPSDLISITYEHRSGHRTCPPNRRHRNRSHGNRRQERVQQTVDDLNLCPVRYVRNLDPNRRPSLIIESECACPAPLNEPELSCYPVTQYVKVYRRVGCQLGVYVYDIFWEPVNVTCVAGFKIPSTNLDVSFKMPE